MIKYGTKNANISVYYIDQEMFGRIENEYQVNRDRIFKYFSEDERSSYYTSWVRIDNSQKEQSADGILKNFSAKRNQKRTGAMMISTITEFDHKLLADLVYLDLTPETQMEHEQGTLTIFPSEASV